MTRKKMAAAKMRTAGQGMIGPAHVVMGVEPIPPGGFALPVVRPVTCLIGHDDVRGRNRLV
jgi:hypothetical protein